MPCSLCDREADRGTVLESVTDPFSNPFVVLLLFFTDAVESSVHRPCTVSPSDQPRKEKFLYVLSNDLNK